MMMMIDTWIESPKIYLWISESISYDVVYARFYIHVGAEWWPHTPQPQQNHNNNLHPIDHVLLDNSIDFFFLGREGMPWLCNNQSQEREISFSFSSCWGPPDTHLRWEPQHNIHIKHKSSTVNSVTLTLSLSRLWPVAKTTHKPLLLPHLKFIL